MNQAPMERQRERDLNMTASIEAQFLVTDILDGIGKLFSMKSGEIEVNSEGWLVKKISGLQGMIMHNTPIHNVYALEIKNDDLDNTPEIQEFTGEVYKQLRAKLTDSQGTSRNEIWVAGKSQVLFVFAMPENKTNDFVRSA